MLQNFKIPVMNPILELNGLLNYMREIFSRWANSDLVKFRVIQIGPLDMDTTPSVTIPFGQEIVIGQIINIFVSIINDAGDKKYSANLTGDDITVEITSTSVIITRKAGGFFDSVDFSSVAASRGEVTICHLT